MCEKFDGENDDLFVFHAKHLRDLLGYHRTQDLIKFLSSLDQVGIMSHTSKNHVIKIKTDILLRLQGRDYRKPRDERAETAPKNKIKNKIKNNTCSFDIEAVYQSYPRKAGKKRGIATLEKTIETEQQYQQLLTAVKNYRDEIDANKTEQRFIKQFSTFANNWEDYLETNHNNLLTRAEDLLGPAETTEVFFE